MLMHHLTQNEVLKKLSTNSETGLSTSEVVSRQATYGENRLLESKKKSTIARFFDQFKDAMILILIAAAIISFIVICVEKNWGNLWETEN